ncbi:DUF362 domain-containing protein [Marinilabilia salmonicolor]|jgi:uncharacterized protein (DUF362 family)|uniref:Uncharacterized protein (DUF362 family) n=1 Tax=Marinilabilia salmonicolor TaxID=989 RepID=A0A2T0XRB3_9BACT|nr:DUF362 domain-containing protein [Marinilabilia salmonicolor]PRZ01456.1 uncharacterized protein (DUF362 family) [Marinilabilia salmonicolor]RCW31990.1 uncharacterized protein (DUF362 family) [Marinilabilia salmonicolor]
MKRRDFLIKGAGLGLAGALIPGFGGLNAVGLPAEEGNYDLVAVRGGEAVDMFEKAMEALGGMGKFVKSGQKVLVKPNIGWDVPPERAGNTNPDLINRIVKSCLNAGASEVVVFDHTCDQWDRCYRNSGLEDAARNAGAKVVPGNNESFYKEVSVPGGVKLKKTKVHRDLMDADVFINVPILKHHGSTTVSLAMKNLMGVVWDRGFYHGNDLSQCIADFLTYRKPDLNIIDGYRMMTRNGPRGVSVSDVANLKALIAGKDIVAVDAAATMMFGEKPENIKHIRLANEMGLGSMDLQNLSIKRVKMA